MEIVVIIIRVDTNYPFWYITAMETIDDFMRKRIEIIGAAESVQRAALKMKDKNVSSLLVNDKDDKPIGLITERDLARKVCIQDVYTSKITTKEIMSSPLITIRSGSSQSEAIDAMFQNNVRHLLVVDSNKTPDDKDKPIGMITPLDFTKSQGYAGSDNNDTIEKLLEYFI